MNIHLASDICQNMDAKHTAIYLFLSAWKMNQKLPFFLLDVFTWDLFSTKLNIKQKQQCRIPQPVLLLLTKTQIKTLIELKKGWN